MKRKEPICYTFFDSIDTEYKAYVLGLIYADGTIDDRVKGLREWRLRVSIQEEDSYVLKNLLNGTNGRDLWIRNPPSTIKNNWKVQRSATINNTYLCKRLIELGCYPRKSKKGMKFPKINEDLIHHFIRGFFDGDGCVTIKKRIYKGKTLTSENFRLSLAFTSTDKQFLETLFTYLPVSKIYRTSRIRSLEVYTYWIERVSDVDSVYKYLYKDANFFFKRKFDKFNMPIKSQVVSTLTEGLETT